LRGNVWIGREPPERERETFMQMAQTWIEAAERLDFPPIGKSDPVDSAFSDLARRAKAKPQEPSDSPK
jgi:hypothetical protein